MASIAQSLPASDADYGWLRRWLRDELTPYPGRARLVGRMVLAVALVTIICETFRLPSAFQAAICVLLVSRESLSATLQSAATILVVTAIGTAYLIVSVWFVISDPLLHFLWIVGSLFLAFYLLSAVSSYVTAIIFALMISIGVPFWDRHVSAETNVEDTLWLCLAVLVGVGIAAAVELIFLRLRPRDEVVSMISQRLSAVENLLTCYADGCAVDDATEQKVFHLEMLGTSLQRRILRRSDYSPRYAERLGGVTVLAGRLVDLAASLMHLHFEPSATDRERFRRLVSTLGSMRSDLANRASPAPVQFEHQEQTAGTTPLLGEMERTVSLIPEVFVGSRSSDEYLPAIADSAHRGLFAPDAFVNPEHLRFALKGCLAASGGYLIYNAVAWPQISTAVTTCLFTALSTIGASRQKQILRIAGAIAGGALGMGAQIFVLPYIDSITAFTIVIGAVTAVASWFLTASPRLSYFGLQVALAFYLIHLQEFTIQTSLAVARDRVVGVLLGLSMMWLVFDRLWGAPAGLELRRTLATNIRLLAQFSREPLSADLKIAAGRGFALREMINANLDKGRALADGLLFEFGPSRQRDMELRDQVRRWQPHLRALFMMRLAAWEYRAQLPGFELPERVRVLQQQYDDHAALILEDVAARIEHNAPLEENRLVESHELLNGVIEAVHQEEAAGLPPDRAASFLALLRKIDALSTSLASEIAAETGLPV